MNAIYHPGSVGSSSGAKYKVRNLNLKTETFNPDLNLKICVLNPDNCFFIAINPRNLKWGGGWRPRAIGAEFFRETGRST